MFIASLPVPGSCSRASKVSASGFDALMPLNITGNGERDP